MFIFLRLVRKFENRPGKSSVNYPCQAGMDVHHSDRGSLYHSIVIFETRDGVLFGWTFIGRVCRTNRPFMTNRFFWHVVRARQNRHWTPMTPRGIGEISQEIKWQRNPCRKCSGFMNCVSGRSIFGNYVRMDHELYVSVYTFSLHVWFFFLFPLWYW